MHEARLRAVWECELDRLELDVLRAERLLKNIDLMPAEPWSPPPVPCQMPADLAARAQALLDRQEQARAALRTALATAQRQLLYADRLNDATGAPPSTPVYLDIEA